MNLTSQQQALLDGAKGPAMAKVVKTLVMYGECFGAERMVPVTGANGHLVTSFGLSMLGPVYDLMDELLKDGALSGQSFSVDPRPLDPAVPANPLQKLLFKSCKSCCSRLCIPNKTIMRHSCAAWVYWTTMLSPAPVTSPRLAIDLGVATS